MTFDAWLALQRSTIATLRVAAGEYLAWHHRPRVGVPTYKATPKLITPGAGQYIVQVTRWGATRARVLLGAAEYDYEPAWMTGQGLSVRRVSPLGRVDVEVEELSKGLARAALLRAAEDEYERLKGLAIEAADLNEDWGKDWGPLLLALTMDASDTSIAPAHRVSIVEMLRDRHGGVELVAVRERCACIGCGRRFEAGPTGRIIHVFDGVVCCEPCLRPESTTQATRAALMFRALQYLGVAAIAWGLLRAWEAATAPRPRREGCPLCGEPATTGVHESGVYCSAHEGLYRAAGEQRREA